jgi:hypothetical protein
MINAHGAVRPTGICAACLNMIGNESAEQNFKPLVDQMQKAHVYLCNSGGRILLGFLKWN